MIDDTLYDAFGQRQVSTIFTAAEPVPRRAGGQARLSGQRPERPADTSTCAPPAAGRCRSAPSPSIETRTAPLAINHQGQFPAVTLSFNLAPGASLGRGGGGDRDGQAASSACRPASSASFQGTAQAFQASLANEPLLILAAAGHGLHRARRALRELHPPDHDPVHAALGRRRRAARAACSAGTDFSVIALIGIILLIGIVKKNAHHDDRLRARRRAQGGQAAGGGDLPGLPAALPPDHDDDDGGAARRRCRWPSAPASGSELRRPLGITIVGGLIFSQVLTLYTTPVIYLAFDRLASARARRRAEPRGRAAPAGDAMSISAPVHPPAGRRPRC